MIWFLLGMGVLASCASYIPYVWVRKHQPCFSGLGERAACLVMGLSGVAAVIFVGIFGLSSLGATAEFLRHVSIWEFLFENHWSVSKAIMLNSYEGSFGALALFWGTIFVAVMAMVCAWSIGYPAAIFASGCSDRVESGVRQACQVFAAIPSIAWASAAVFVVIPFTQRMFGASSNNALAASLTMGFMLAPWVCLFVLRGIREIPAGQIEAAKALGLDERQVHTFIVRPQAASEIRAALVATGGKALVETMVVLMATGLRPRLSLDPLQEVSTATVQIASIMTGDLPFDHPVVTASFALLSFLVLFSLLGNLLLSRYETIKRVGKDSPTGNGIGMVIIVLPLRVWLARNMVACGVLLAVPLSLIAYVGCEAVPALFTVDVELPCAAEGSTALSVLVQQLDLGQTYATLDRNDRRAVRQLLQEPDDVVSCGQKIVAGEAVIAWYVASWFGWGGEPPRFAGELANKGLLHVVLRTDLLGSADSSFASRAGLAQSIIGTMWTIAIIVVFVVPIGVLGAVFLHFYLHARGGWRENLADAIEVIGSAITGFPVIGFGMLGSVVFVGVCGFPRGSSLVIGLTVGAIAFPFVLITALVAIKAVAGKKGQIEAAQGMGLSRFEAIWKIILPQAGPGILGGVIFAVAHAVGETAALLPIGGKAFVASVSLGIFDSSTTLAGQAYIWSQRAEPGFENLCSLAILTLLLICLSLSFVGVKFSEYNERHRQKRGGHKAHKPGKPHRAPVAAVE